MNNYDHKNIEKKWQDKWESDGVYRTQESGKPKQFILDMFPYPSGEGLHVGHPRGYIATDVYSRMKRMQGFDVLHPMGWDAFGLPAENFAIKNKIHPSVAVGKNVARFKEQLSIIGLDYDWSREINTTDPEFYKWTQWIFLQMLKKGLAYESYEPINWCPSCQTGLANEDVEADGTCERCGTIVEKKPMRQWVLKITDYADRLLADLDKLPKWPNGVKEAQRHWIGRSEGSEVEFSIIEDEIIDYNTGPGGDAFREGEPVVERNNVVVIIEHPDKNEFLCARWKQVDWCGFVTGGIEEGESIEDTAINEVVEETGYKNPEIIKVYNKSSHGIFWHVVKKQNRHANYKIVHVKLKDLERDEPSDTEKEIAEFVWVPKEKVDEFLMREDMKYPWRVVNGDDYISNIKVFTTRVDTLFGVTYVVLAPDHEFIQKFKSRVSNLSEVEKYIEDTRKKSELDRQQNKDKTGVEIKGIKAINPANGEAVPVWIADYVLTGYGTGAVMAVPAHDERDFEFAKKYKLPVVDSVATTAGEILPDVKEVFGSVAIAFDPKKNKFLKLINLKSNEAWLPGGGKEEGETFLETAIRELKEEAGISVFDSVVKLGSPIISYYFNNLKNSNRKSLGYNFLFFVDSENRVDYAHEEHEQYEVEFVEYEDLYRSIEKTNGGVDHWLEALSRAKKYIETKNEQSFLLTSDGVLINSGKFDGLTSEEARKQITEFVGGKIVKNYKIKDWVFSRQRYWGEPIPVVHCDKCGVVAVPESELPITLPNVDSYEPSGTGESPLANITDWVNTTCPECGGPAKRETNTMPQWAGSSWYYLRFIDPKNSNNLIDKEKEKKWMPVDVYVGGDHATRHLIYARFWHKFLFDIGAVSTEEPFPRLEFLGFILAEDGRKMSKRWGNIVNPDEMVDRFGADAFRLYEMFIGPFENTVRWNTDGVVGTYRFLEKIWKITQSNFSDESDKSIKTILNRTIAKVDSDIETFKFNTAISSMMIFINEISGKSISKEDFKKFLQLLAPFAPHIAEELWNEMGENSSIHLSDWPKYDEKLIIEEEKNIAVSFNGKGRGVITVLAGSDQDLVLDKVFELGQFEKYRPVSRDEIKNIIFVKDRIINIIF